MVRVPSAAVVLSAVIAAGCGSAKGASSPAAQQANPAAVPVSVTAVVEEPIARFIRVTGTLAAEEQADVAAETQGRVVATPVERGTRVRAGADLIRIAPAEASAQAAEAGPMPPRSRAASRSATAVRSRSIGFPRLPTPART